MAGALGLVAAVVLGAMFAGQATRSRLDARLAAVVELPTGSAPIRYPVSIIVQSLADPIPGAGIVAALALLCWWRGCRRLAAVAVVAPVVTDLAVITAKHIVGRTIHGDGLSYPSTHAAHSAAVALVAALFACTLLDLGPRVTAAVALGSALAATTVMGWALVAGNVHYGTDVLGGLGVALAVLPIIGYAIDSVADRLTPAWTAGSTRNAHPARSAERDGRPRAGSRTPR